MEKNTKPLIPTTFSRTITLSSLIIITGISGFCGFFSEQADTTLKLIQSLIFKNMSWYYVLLVTIFIVFLASVAISRFGSIKLGEDYSKPRYSRFSWFAMLFSAGMGVGLMFFGVGESVSHYAQPINPGLSEIDRIRDAQLYTFFHWGIHAWSIYAVVALSLSYFSYRYKLPLSIRSAFYPLLKEKIYGKSGDIIDIFALCCTFFGIATTLGFGVVQMNAGFKSIGLIPETNFFYQAILICLIMSVSIASAISGIDNGIKILSNLNIIMALGLMLFVLGFGPTSYLLGSFCENIGNYISHLSFLTFNTFALEPEKQKWVSGWTILYWAWWISWAPFVGYFIASISRGRTVREFILGVILVPSLFNFLWMTFFGSNAIWLDRTEAAGALSALTGNIEFMLFKFLEYFPYSEFLKLFAVLMIIVFFVTSADSGILVMNRIASRGKEHSPKWQTGLWGILLIIFSLTLLHSGGLGALQTLTLIAAFPFSIIMLLMCYCLWRAMYVDVIFHEYDFAHGSSSWNGTYWKNRLKRVVTFPEGKDILKFIERDVFPAFEEIQNELDKNGIRAEIRKGRKSSRPYIELVIPYDKFKNFIYGVFAEPQNIPNDLVHEKNVPSPETDITYIPLTYFNDGRTGHDIQYMRKEEIISDIIREYERYIGVVRDHTGRLLAMDKQMQL